MSHWRRRADRLLGSRLVGTAIELGTTRRLRVLGYHGVHDAERFAAQLELIATGYHPVSAADVVKAVRGELDLPRRAVWLTFDDGDPSVVETALPLLQRHGIAATVFVCPGLVGTEDAFGWEQVETALDAGESVDLSGRRYGRGDAARLVALLKTVPDEERRRVVARLAEGRQWRRRQLTVELLENFVAGGGSVGNHTWDHPCLDRCPPEEVVRQIRAADQWLAARFPGQPRLFAYPNGNHTSFAEQILRELGYEVACLFDHRLASVRRAALRMSRLRINDHTEPVRASAILSGAHPLAHRLRWGVS